MNSRRMNRRQSIIVRTQGNQDAPSISIIHLESPEPPALIRAYNLLGEVYNEFANESSIHGIKYTSRTKSIPERIFWLFIITISVIAAGVLAEKFYYRHKQANMRTIVLSHQYPAWKTPLPAITICYPTLASHDRLAKYRKGVKELKMPYGLEEEQFLIDLQFLQEILIPTNHFEAAMSRLHWVLYSNNMTIKEFFTIVSPSCDDYPVVCRFEGEMRICDKILKPSLTPYGLCCSLNYAYVDGKLSGNDDEEIYTARFGHNYIFSVLLKDYGRNDRISGLTYGDGARVLIHDRYSYPGPSSHEFIASQGSEIIAHLHGRKLTASAEVLSLPRNERDCRTPQQSATQIYRVDNCLAECHERMIRSYCDCVPFYGFFKETNDTLCSFLHVACLSRVKPKVLQTSPRGEPCNCLPDCYGTSYSIATTVVPMNAVKHNPSEFYQKALKYENATAIHIAFTRQTAMLMRRDLVLSWINLVSSLGGVFSLFLGCSFISVVEIIYFIVYYITKLIKNREKNLERP